MRRLPVLLVLLAASTHDASALRAKQTLPKRSVVALPPKPHAFGLLNDREHPRRVDAKVLLKEVAALLGGKSPTELSRVTRRLLLKLAGEQRSAQLREHRVLDRLTDLLLDTMDRDDATIAAGEVIAGAKHVAMRDPAEQAFRKDDAKEMVRGYGSRMLSNPVHDDPVFNDPTYLAEFVRRSGQIGNGWSEMGVGSEWAFRGYHAEWKRIAPSNTKMISFTQTGSDANSLLYDIAVREARKRGSTKPQQVEILKFAGAYGGLRGQLQNVNFTDRTDMESLIPDPTTPRWDPKNKATVAALRQTEDDALAFIRRRVTSTEGAPVGGIFIEPIQSYSGVKFYRPVFMRKLRRLADELGIKIFADEIGTGGGRTGKFFAWQHYPGFEPDYFTIGKGMLVCGVGSVERKGRAEENDYAFPRVTMNSQPIDMLKGAQFLRALADDHLMENATAMGELIKQKLRAQKRTTPDGPIRGKGLLIHVGDQYADGTSHGRLMPSLRITKQDIEAVFGRN